MMVVCPSAARLRLLGDFDCVGHSFGQIDVESVIKCAHSWSAVALSDGANRLGAGVPVESVVRVDPARAASEILDG
jgi:hypothetical protein